MKKLTVVASMLFLVSLVLAACGAGTGSSGADSTTLTITMTEFSYQPDAWTVTAGQPVTVQLTNNGTLPHTWTIMKTPISGSYTSADQTDILYTSPVVASGSSTTISFTAPSTPGTYQVVCTQPGHFDAGMLGQLTVK